MVEFWTNLSGRERLILAVGAVIVIVASAFLFVWTPLDRWRDDAADAAGRAEGQYAIVREAAMRRPVQPVPGDGDGGALSLRNAIYQSAANASVTLNYVNESSNGRIAVNVSGADPSAVYAWLARLEADDNTRIVSIDLARERVGDAEALNVQAVFER